jgi:hypothetical protein
MKDSKSRLNGKGKPCQSKRQWESGFAECSLFVFLDSFVRRLCDSLNTWSQLDELDILMQFDSIYDMLASMKIQLADFGIVNISKVRLIISSCQFPQPTPPLSVEFLLHYP